MRTWRVLSSKGWTAHLIPTPLAPFPKVQRGGKGSAKRTSCAGWVGVLTRRSMARRKG